MSDTGSPGNEAASVVLTEVDSAGHLHDICGELDSEDGLERLCQGQLRRFTSLGADRRKVTDRSVLEFVREKDDFEFLSRHYVLKFFAKRKDFLRTKQLYSQKCLGGFMPAVVQFVDCRLGSEEDDCVVVHPAQQTTCIVMECGVLLQDHIKPGPEQATERAKAIADVAKLLAAIHQRRWTVNKIFPSNIVWLPQQGRWAFVDLSCATEEDSKLFNVDESSGVEFRKGAPEVANLVREENLSRAVHRCSMDMWRLGVLAFEQLSHLSLDEHLGFQKVHAQWGTREHNLRLEARVSAEASDALGPFQQSVLGALAYDPRRRLTAQQLCDKLTELQMTGAECSRPTHAIQEPDRLGPCSSRRLCQDMSCTEPKGGHDGHWGIRDVTWNAKGNMLASCCEGRRLILWNVQPAAVSVVAHLEGHNHYVTSVSISHDGTIVATGSDDCKVKLWCKEDEGGEWTHWMNLIGQHSKFVQALKWSPTEVRLASVALDGKVAVWHPREGTLTLDGHAGQSVWTVAWSPDGSLLASGGDDKCAVVWRISDSEITSRFDLDSAVHAVAFSPDGRQLAVGTETEGTILYSASTGAKLHTFASSTGCVWALSWTRDSALLAVGTQQAAELLCLLTGYKLRTLCADCVVRGVAWCPDDCTLAVACHAHANRVRLYRVRE